MIDTLNIEVLYNPAETLLNKAYWDAYSYKDLSVPEEGHEINEIWDTFRCIAVASDKNGNTEMLYGNKLIIKSRYASYGYIELISRGSQNILRFCIDSLPKMLFAHNIYTFPTIDDIQYCISVLMPQYLESLGFYNIDLYSARILRLDISTSILTKHSPEHYAYLLRNLYYKTSRKLDKYFSGLLIRKNNNSLGIYDKVQKLISTSHKTRVFSTSGDLLRIELQLRTPKLIREFLSPVIEPRYENDSEPIRVSDLFCYYHHLRKLLLNTVIQTFIPVHNIYPLESATADELCKSVDAYLDAVYAKHKTYSWRNSIISRNFQRLLISKGFNTVEAIESMKRIKPIGSRGKKAISNYVFLKYRVYDPEKEQYLINKELIMEVLTKLSRELTAEDISMMDLVHQEVFPLIQNRARKPEKSLAVCHSAGTVSMIKQEREQAET